MKQIHYYSELFTSLLKRRSPEAHADAAREEEEKSGIHNASTVGQVRHKKSGIRDEEVDRFADEFMEMDEIHEILDWAEGTYDGFHREQKRSKIWAREP